MPDKGGGLLSKTIVHNPVLELLERPEGAKPDVQRQQGSSQEGHLINSTRDMQRSPAPRSLSNSAGEHHSMHSRMVSAHSLGVFERHLLLGGGDAGPARTPNMAIDESTLRDCLKHVLSLCYATDPSDWAKLFAREIRAWVYDYSFNAHVVITDLATPDHTGEPRFSAEECEARFYACRRAMAGLTEECDLLVRQGAHAYRAATRAGHTVLDGQDYPDSLDEDAFRCTFGWWSPAERLHIRATKETEPFHRSERIRIAAAALGFDFTPRDPVSQYLRLMYPPPRTAEESVKAKHYFDSWERGWRSDDFEREYALPDDCYSDTSSDSGADECEP
ncbi:hypothetical protein K488DRAFT_74499 [Vararia minispora EC-137]|uniref:Uncharacterized protein n=1 Tax=Vararia minispora EC-137 TaxID=1314806 RepID=A0ACB8Q703_9AGAM|nr:hypothetical protein K488DRAFT_74499 [Vararia minispora EC-137]